MRIRTIASSTLAGAVIVLASAFGAGAAPTPSSTAAPAASSLSPVTLGTTCIGTFGGTFHFSINAVEAVPAGTSWTMTAQGFGWPSYVTLGGTSDSTLVQATPQGNQSTRFTAPVGIPAGTVVLVRPNAVWSSAQGATTVTLSGSGGSASGTWRGGKSPCSG